MPHSKQETAQKKTAGPEGPAASFQAQPDLEVESDAGVNVPAESVIHLDVRVAAAGARRASLATHQRRITIEDVLRTETERVVIANREGRSEIEVALRRDPVVGRTVGVARQSRVRAGQVLIDATEVAPLGRQADSARARPRQTQLVAPFGVRRAALVSVETGAVVRSGN